MRDCQYTLNYPNQFIKRKPLIRIKCLALFVSSGSSFWIAILAICKSKSSRWSPLFSSSDFNFPKSHPADVSNGRITKADSNTSTRARLSSLRRDLHAPWVYSATLIAVVAKTASGETNSRKSSCYLKIAMQWSVSSRFITQQYPLLMSVAGSFL